MSTQTSTLEVNRKRVPFHRLVDVEFRKLLDTRAGFWLLALLVIIVVLVQSAILVTALFQSFPMSWGLLFITMSSPLGILLAVLGIMTVTSEWGQRTSLVTFSLEPRRVRVVAAKLVAGISASLVAVLISVALSATTNGAYGLFSSNDVEWDMTGRDIMFFVLYQLAAFLLGFAFGMLIPNTPAAIVLYFVFQFVVPTVMTAVSMLWEWFEAVLPWVHLTRSLSIFETGEMSGVEIAHFATSFGVWIVLPLVLGTILLLRREIK